MELETNVAQEKLDVQEGEKKDYWAKIKLYEFAHEMFSAPWTRKEFADHLIGMGGTANMASILVATEEGGLLQSNVVKVETEGKERSKKYFAISRFGLSKSQKFWIETISTVQRTRDAVLKREKERREKLVEQHQKELSKLTQSQDSEGMQLGRVTETPKSPEEAVLDRVKNPHNYSYFVARFTAPEFTSLCPVTGQPDFAILVIDYMPNEWMVESKSLKLYLTSFRNHGAFHEDCTVSIGRRLFDTLKPHWLRIGGYWYPRGGIPIDVFWEAGDRFGLWVPDQGVSTYSARR